MIAIIAIPLIIFLSANLLRGISEATTRQDKIMEEERQAKNN